MMIFARTWSIRSSLGALCLALFAAAPTLAQGAQSSQSAALPNRSGPAVCYGFSFGNWNPPLDWRSSGHASVLDSARVPRAPGGRGWAADDIEAQSDTTLLLFPPWWPAGVLVRFGAKPASLNDTVAGRAIAFVADGRKQPSTSSIRAWLVPCQS